MKSKTSIVLFGLLTMVLSGGFAAEKAETAEPVLRKVVEPSVPHEYARYGVEGNVTVRFLVTENGEVRDVVVENASHPEYARSVTNAVRNWRFEPLRKEGKATASVVRVPVRFVGSGS